MDQAVVCFYCECIINKRIAYSDMRNWRSLLQSVIVLIFSTHMIDISVTYLRLFVACVHNRALHDEHLVLITTIINSQQTDKGEGQHDSVAISNYEISKSAFRLFRFSMINADRLSILIECTIYFKCLISFGYTSSS